MNELDIEAVDHFHSHCLGRFCFQPAKGKRIEYHGKWPKVGPVCLKILHAIQWNPGVYLNPRELVDLTGIKSLMNPGVLTACVMKLREAHGEKGSPHFIQSNVAGGYHVMWPADRTWMTIEHIPVAASLCS